MKRSAATLAKDLLRLLDLQVQLLTFDISDFWKRARLGIVLIVMGAVTLLGAIPVLLYGAAELLHRYSELPIELSLLIAGGVALILGCLCLWISLSLLTKASTSLERSRSELKSNLDWLRAVLTPEEE